MSTALNHLWVKGAFLALAIAAGGYLFVEWTINRVYVPVGKSLVLTYKGPVLFGPRVPTPVGQLATVTKDGAQQIGVLAEMKGPGRHFYSPIWWRTELVEDVLVQPGEVAVFISQVGEVRKAEASSRRAIPRRRRPGRDQPAGRTPQGLRPRPLSREPLRLQVADHQGKDRRAGRPGETLRLGRHSHRLRRRRHEPVRQPVDQGPQGDPADRAPAGHLSRSIPPSRRSTLWKIGFREKSIVTTEQRDAQGNRQLDPVSGEPLMAPDSGGIAFPSKDGFTIHMDFTAVWGIMPEQAPEMIRLTGNLQKVEDRVVIPQIESRSAGTKARNWAPRNCLSANRGSSSRTA